MNKLKQNFAPLLFATIVIGLFALSFWSHVDQEKEIDILANETQNLGQSIESLRTVLSVNGNDNFLVGASTLFAQNASVQLSLEVLGNYASTSGNLSFNGEIMPDGATCSNNEILKKTGTNNWDCAADASGTFDSTTVDNTTWSDSANATNVWTFDVSGTDHTLTFGSNYSLFSGGVSTSLNFEAFGYASASKYFGTALTDCDSNGSQLLWSDTGLFSCQTLADADIPDTLTITNLSGTNTGDVTLAGTPNYITLANQVLTLTKLDISDDTNLTAGTDLTLTTNDLTLDSTLTQAFSFTNTGSQSMTGSLNVSKGLVANKYSGGGLTDCLSAGNVLRYNGGIGFSCGTLADADIPDTISLIGGTIGANNISGTQTTTGTTTFGDNGDNIVFDSNTWDINGAGVGSGFTGFTSTGVIDFGGATSTEIVQNGTVNATGEITVHTTSNSFDWYNGSRIVVQKEEYCFTYYIPDPTSANDKWIGHKRFNDPFTITEVLPTASGSNAAGWNLYYGNPGSLTTAVFTNAKSASTSLPNIRYTSFANSTLSEGQILDVVITSASATLQDFSVNVCGRDNH